MSLKKFQIELIQRIPGHIALKRVDIWFQDEARFGQQNTTTRIWSTKGSRPRVVKQQQFEYAYLFGAVCPATGETEALIAPWVNPPYSPELNPIEQVWSWLRQHCLANRCFNGYSDIVNACSDAWNHFVADIQQVKTLCSRSWIKVVN